MARRIPHDAYSYVSKHLRAYCGGGPGLRWRRVGEWLFRLEKGELRKALDRKMSEPEIIEVENAIGALIDANIADLKERLAIEEAAKAAYVDERRQRAESRTARRLDKNADEMSLFLELCVDGTAFHSQSEREAVRRAYLKDVA